MRLDDSTVISCEPVPVAGRQADEPASAPWRERQEDEQRGQGPGEHRGRLRVVAAFVLLVALVASR